jgi:hypothetical protein
MPRTGGVGDLLALLLLLLSLVEVPLDEEAKVSFRLANNASDVASRMPLRVGVMGTGAAIWLGMFGWVDYLIRL